MKVGVDGVTLGAWCDVSRAKRVLDVGSGSGLIALMVAQRSKAQIIAIDIDNHSFQQTYININQSPWSERIVAFHISLQDFAIKQSDKFDHIVSNPPYFSNSLKSKESSRNLARHNESLPLQDLIKISKSLLTNDGKLSLILPVDEAEQACVIAKENALFCSKKLGLKPLPNKNFKRLLLEFQTEEIVCQHSELIIENERGIYTPQYAEMVKEFYLKL